MLRKPTNLYSFQQSQKTSNNQDLQYEAHDQKRKKLEQQRRKQVKESYEYSSEHQDQSSSCQYVHRNVSPSNNRINQNYHVPNQAINNRINNLPLHQNVSASQFQNTMTRRRANTVQQAFTNPDCQKGTQNKRKDIYCSQQQNNNSLERNQSQKWPKKKGIWRQNMDTQIRNKENLISGSNYVMENETYRIQPQRNSSKIKSPQSVNLPYLNTVSNYQHNNFSRNNFSNHQQVSHSNYQNQLLLPVVNTNNYHSNTLSEQSSISQICESSRVKDIHNITQAQNQSNILKQKLIQTHQKLIKQLEISKQLEDNFFELKKRYDKKTKQIEEEIKIATQQKNSYWRKQVDNLKLQLQRKIIKQQQNEQIAQNFEQLQINTHNFKSILEKSQLQKQQLVEQAQSYKQKTVQLKTDLQSMRNKVLQLSKQKQNIEEEVQEYKEAQESIQKRFKQRQKQFQARIQLAEDKLNKKEKQFGEKGELCEIWRKKYSDLQQLHSHLEETCVKHEKELNEVKSTNGDISIALRQQKQKNAQMLSQIISIQVQTKQVKSKVAALQQQKAQLLSKVSDQASPKSMQYQRQQFQQKIYKMTQQYNELTVMMNKKDKEIAQLRNQLSQKSQVLKRLNKELIQNNDGHVKGNQFNVQQKGRIVQQNGGMSNNKINSVRAFVNRLEEESQKSVAAKRASQQIIKQNISSRDSFSNRQSLSLNQLQQPSSPKLSPVSKTPTKNQKSFSSSSNGLSLNSLEVSLRNPNTNKNVKIQSKPIFENQNQDSSEQVNQYYDQQQDFQNYPNGQYQNQQQNNYGHNSNDFYCEDSLQNSYKINKPSLQIKQKQKQKSVSKRLSANNIQVSNTKPGKSPLKQIIHSQSKQKGLSSYKQQKQQYMSLLQEITQLQTQSYNLTVQKSKIVEQIDKIEYAKVKTKQLVSKRRQLELWLLGNEKKNNEVKQRLKVVRGKVV